MERTGLTPPGAVTAPDLAQVLQAPGPFVTVYLTTESGIDNAAHRSEQHWKALRAELAEGGVPEDVLVAVDPLVPDAHLQGQTLGVVANGGGVLHVEHSPDLPPRDRGEMGPLPPLVPILAWRQGFPSYLTVLADRTGADLEVVRHGRAEMQEEAGGAEGPIARSKPGGWSQLRYQHRAENTWEENAELVAREVVRLVEGFDPRVVVAAGDVRALELLQKELPQNVLERLLVVDGGRSQDGSEDVFAARVQEQLTAVVNSDTADLLSKLREELGQGDRAADGRDDTIAALIKAQVEVLLVREQPDDTRMAFFGPEPTQVALLRDDLVAMGVEQPQEARLVDVAVRAALGTGAGIRVVPEGELPTGGIGAILRWP